MLTPLEIDAKAFKKSLIGYTKKDVIRFIEEIQASYEKVYRENIELKDKINVLNEGISYYKTLEKTLQNTLLLAEKTSEEIKANAHKKAEQIEKEAELKAETIVQEARSEVFRINQRKEELTKQYDASKIQIKQFLKAQLELTEMNSLDTMINSNSSNVVDIFKNEVNEADAEIAATNIEMEDENSN